VTFDPRWKHVTCKRCGTHYQCTPDHDYYGTPGQEVTGPDDGYCLKCLFIVSGHAEPDTIVTIHVQRTEVPSGRVHPPHQPC
jgi:hypothetical protein